MPDNWNSSESYEYFMGRWSNMMAPVFLRWLDFPSHKSWLEVGCGTGALSEEISIICDPEHLTCVDPSDEFLLKAKERNLQQTDFLIGTASSIPIDEDTFDITVSGLALNFFPDLDAAFTEFKRLLKPDGTIAAYVWDYSGKMEFLRIFWDSVCEIDEEAYNLDEGYRFPICNIERLQEEFKDFGLIDVQSSYLSINTIFKDFDDFWNPFLGGQGPAPGYLASLNSEKKRRVKIYC